MKSYWQIFRLIFIIFFLYLMGDIFYRWDGFKFYASFYEFIPSVGLIMILWSIVATIAALLVSLAFSMSSLVSKLVNSKIKTEQLKIFISFLIVVVLAVLYSKHFLIGGDSTRLVKLAVLFGTIFTALFFTWLLRNQHERINHLINALQERITPLVWLFGTFVIISIPVVAYHTCFKQTDLKVSQQLIQDSVSDHNRPNILLVTFDALTARDMSVYGYHRKTTPFISKWAQTASLFTRAEAASNATSPATASLMTGKRLWTHQMIHQKGSKPIRVDYENLPLLLKSKGYFNIALVANSHASVDVLGIDNSFDIAPSAKEFNISAFQSTIGFDFIDNYLYELFSNKIRFYDWLLKEDFIFYITLKSFIRDYSHTRVPPNVAFRRFLEILESKPPEPYFVWIHVFPPHNPFLPPKPYMGMFEPSLKLRSFNSQMNLLEGKFDPQKALVGRGRYDEFIRFCDKQFEDFIADLSIKGELKNTVIILSADHGESFEHGKIGHNYSALFEQTTHVPLIIKEPNQQEGVIINELVEQIDIPTTILDLANIPVPSWMEGQSLVPLLRRKEIPSKAIYSGFFNNNPSRSKITIGTVVVWEGDYKLMHFLKSNTSILFNLKQDPAETNNLFHDNHELGKRLLTLALNKLKDANEKISNSK